MQKGRRQYLLEAGFSQLGPQISFLRRPSIARSRVRLLESGNDILPLGFDVQFWKALTGLPIPVHGIAIVTLNTMQMSVDQRTLLARHVLGDLVSPIPVTVF